MLNAQMHVTKNGAAVRKGCEQLTYLFGDDMSEQVGLSERLDTGPLFLLVNALSISVSALKGYRYSEEIRYPAERNRETVGVVVVPKLCGLNL